ncbi:hypothetical protein E2C01_095332 [Portunus trituberculatus]|uniref:Homeodomain-like domain-containing protein n=1 Tax=Portunus trituberculatus TaxID=210409 RepID=A0A5B7K3I2_PORTR|nr:hypothetical protein [Portunus trituberculatus]
MGLRKELTKDQISGISTLSQVGKGNKEIAAITGVTLCSVQRWTKKCRDAGGSVPLPSEKKRTRRPRVTSTRTLKILKCQVDNEPRISAKELK